MGRATLRSAKSHGSALWMKYEMDGKIIGREFHSPRYWHTLLRLATSEGKHFKLLELDRHTRYRELFPAALMKRLVWFRKTQDATRPAARLYDPKGSAIVDLLRCHDGGLSVDVLHNLACEQPLAQTVWVADLMALRPMLGIELVRDYTFLPSSDTSLL